MSLSNLFTGTFETSAIVIHVISLIKPRSSLSIILSQIINNVLHSISLTSVCHFDILHNSSFLLFYSCMQINYNQCSRTMTTDAGLSHITCVIASTK